MQASDPFFALLGAHPTAGFGTAEHEAQLAADFPWDESTRPLEVLDESAIPWISAMRQQHGDEHPPDYNKYNAEDLKVYPEQRFAYELIVGGVGGLLSGFASEPLYMVIAGPGGAGKSHVLHCSMKTILEIAKAASHTGVPARVCAPTGSAAAQVYGGTVHSFIRYNPSRSFADSY